MSKLTKEEFLNAVLSYNFSSLDWKKTYKNSYEVYLCSPKIGTEVDNFLELSHYKTSKSLDPLKPSKNFVISGTVGEMWVIDFDKLSTTYTFEDGSEITKKSLEDVGEIIDGELFFDWIKIKTKQNGAKNFAIHLPIEDIKNFPIETSWKETLIANRDGILHSKGDYLVCAVNKDGTPKLDDVWVVNGEVFETTYNMENFLDLIPIEKRKVKTPRPEPIT